jgi:hypothetical protein
MVAGMILTVTTTRNVFRMSRTTFRVAARRNPAEVAVLATIERFYRRSWLHRPTIGGLETTDSSTRLPHLNHEAVRCRATRRMSGRAALGQRSGK